MLVASTAPAQSPPTIVSTIPREGSAASRVDRVLEGLVAARSAERWSFRRLASCADLREALRDDRAQTTPLAALTTPDCLEGAFEATSVSANVGFAMYCFARGKGQTIGTNTRIGILNRDDQFRFRIIDGLRAWWGVESFLVDAGSDTYSELLEGLDLMVRPGDPAPSRPKLDVICVIDDGTGTSPAELLLANDSTHKALDPVWLSPPTASGNREAETEFGMKVLAVSSRFVRPPWPGAPSDEIGTVMVFAAGRTRPGEPLGQASVFVAAAAAGDRPPLSAVLPILVTRGAVPPEVSEAVSDALLAAPVDGLINPCRPDHQNMYRSFLRGAIGAASRDPVVVAPLWEHATLLHSRNEPGDAVNLEVRHLEEALSWSRGAPVPLEVERLVAAFTAEHAAGSCPAPWRWFFRNEKLASFQYGVRRLRDALAEATVDTSSDAFREAAICLRQAFNEHEGRVPDCGERSSGMWTAYYAPYLPMAVIETESRHARR